MSKSFHVALCGAALAAICAATPAVAQTVQTPAAFWGFDAVSAPESAVTSSEASSWDAESLDLGAMARSGQVSSADRPELAFAAPGIAVTASGAIDWERADALRAAESRVRRRVGAERGAGLESFDRSLRGVR